MTFIEWITSLWKRRKPPPLPPTPPPDNGDMLALHNAERQRRRVLTLVPDARLTSAAQAHATWMAERGELSHTGLHDRVSRVGYPWTKVAENVAAGAGLDARGAWMLWMASPGHLANAVDPAMRDVGFGSAVGRDGHTYWCTVYGRTG